RLQESAARPSAAKNQRDKMRTENREDIENVEAWAELIKDVLWLMPVERRADVLALAVKNEGAEHEERVTRGGALKFIDLTDDSWMNSPRHRHRNVIMRLRSLVVQVFVRRITNNHSKEDAAQILFAPHPYGNGSGLLQDYLRDLPKIELEE